MRISEPFLWGRNTSILYIYRVCMREARPDLSMRTTPCMKYRDAWCGAWSFPPYRAELDKPPPSQSKQHRALSCLFPVSLSCSRTCLAKMLKYKQKNVCKLLLMAFCLPVPNSLFFFFISVRCVKQFVYFCISLGVFCFFCLCFNYQYVQIKTMNLQNELPN